MRTGSRQATTHKPLPVGRARRARRHILIGPGGGRRRAARRRLPSLACPPARRRRPCRDGRRNSPAACQHTTEESFSRGGLTCCLAHRRAAVFPRTTLAVLRLPDGALLRPMVNCRHCSPRIEWPQGRRGSVMTDHARLGIRHSHQAGGAGHLRVAHDVFGPVVLPGAVTRLTGDRRIPAIGDVAGMALEATRILLTFAGQ
jgi:hypothetical protein